MYTYLYSTFSVSSTFVSRSEFKISWHEIAVGNRQHLDCNAASNDEIYTAITFAKVAQYHMAAESKEFAVIVNRIYGEIKS